MKILIICGHGDGDPGACACGCKEADLVREYAPTLRKALSQYAEVDLYDTSKNMYKQLKNGMAFNFKNYDYVLELHFNAAAKDPIGNGITTGTEIIVHTSEKGITVEQLILDKICSLGFKNRGVKKQNNLLNMNVCKGTQGVSYALLETCFIDDADDMALYTSKKTKIVTAIAAGIVDGFGLEPIKKTLESASDIAHELNKSHFPIYEMENFIKALEGAKKDSSPLYWGYYKLVNHVN